MNQIKDSKARALARTGDPQTSKDAAEKMVKSGELNRQEKMVYDHIELWLFSGKNKDFTTKNIASEIPMPYHKAYDICRRRFSDLEMKDKIELVYGLIAKPGLDRIVKRRDGCRVWRLK